MTKPAKFHARTAVVNHVHVPPFVSKPRCRKRVSDSQGTEPGAVPPLLWLLLPFVSVADQAGFGPRRHAQRFHGQPTVHVSRTTCEALVQTRQPIKSVCRMFSHTVSSDHQAPACHTIADYDKTASGRQTSIARACSRLSLSRLWRSTTFDVSS